MADNESRARENRAPELLAVLCTGLGIASILVGLRFWVRARVLRNIGQDDWWSLASLILSLGGTGTMAVSCYWGLGRHTDTLTYVEASRALKFLYITFGITPSAEAAAKISLTVMLMRITVSKLWKAWFWSWIFLMVAITVCCMLAFLLSCSSIPALWDVRVEAQCNVPLRTVNLYAQGVIAAAHDMVLAISPIFLLWKVQIDRRSKLLLCGLLSLGFFTAVAGIVRLAYSYELVDVVDPTWDTMNFLAWKFVELPLSIIVGCLPTLRPLVDGFKKGKRYPGSYDRNKLRAQSSPYNATSSRTDRIRKTTEVRMTTDSASDHHLIDQAAMEMAEQV